jgi:hypothetical protein
MSKNITSLLIKARLDIQPPAKTGTNPHFRSRYVTLEGCIEAVTQPLANHGFFLSQQVFTNEHGSFVDTILMHEDDPTWEIVSHVPLVLGKNDMQGLGSAITYARRYGIMSLLNLPAEDDDGNAASRSSGPPKGQAQSSGGDAW